jgi:hypothetical protein
MTLSTEQKDKISGLLAMSALEHLGNLVEVMLTNMSVDLTPNEKAELLDAAVRLMAAEVPNIEGDI